MVLAEASATHSGAAVAELIGISKVYGRGDLEVKALDQLNLIVREGDYLAVMGASGSGKSTAMNILGCLDRPSHGCYLLNGMAVSSWTMTPLRICATARLGSCSNSSICCRRPSPRQRDVADDLRRHSRRAPAQSREALIKVGLGKRLENRPNQLSGGQQQRVAIARAIINRPSLLLADEPTGALDSNTTAEVLDLFDDLHSQGITLVMVTHEDDVAARARQIARFQDGRIVEMLSTKQPLRMS